MRISLDNKTALITGGSRGLGAAMATTFAEAGADVIILARRAGPLEDTRRQIADKTKRRILGITCDVGDAKSIDEACAEAKAFAPTIDILVNNAGTSARQSFEAIEDQAWLDDFGMKVVGAARLVRHLLPQMKQQRWGRILFVLSTSSKTPGSGQGPTIISRAAGTAMMKVLATECAPHNVLVNGLCIGLINSDQWVRFHKRDAPDISFDEYKRRRGASLPLGRIGEAEELAAIACFLASDKASYISGAAINIDGGASPVG